METNQEPSEYEQYVFSILPLTNHQYNDEEQLMRELCSITPKLNIFRDPIDGTYGLYKLNRIF